MFMQYVSFLKIYFWLHTLKSSFKISKFVLFVMSNTRPLLYDLALYLCLPGIKRKYWEELGHCYYKTEL